MEDLGLVMHQAAAVERSRVDCDSLRASKQEKPKAANPPCAPFQLCGAGGSPQ